MAVTIILLEHLIYIHVTTYQVHMSRLALLQISQFLCW